MEFSEASKTAFLVSKEVSQADWGWQNLGNDISTLHLQIQQTWTQVVNVYIPESQYHPDEHTQTFFNLAQVLNRIRVPTLLLGDFNTHHLN